MNVYRVTLRREKWDLNLLVAADTSSGAVKKACYYATEVAYETRGCHAKNVELMGELVQ